MSSENSKNKSILAKKVFCKECGRTMVHRVEFKKNKKGTSEYRAFHCQLCKERQTYNNVKEKKLIEMLHQYMDKSKLDLTEKISEKTFKEKTKNYDLEIARLDKELQILYEKYKGSEITKAEYIKQKSEVNHKKLALVEEQKDYEQNQIVRSEENKEKDILKIFAQKYVEKIIVSRFGDVEIEMKKL